MIIVLCIFSCRKDENNYVAPGDASIVKYLFDAIKDEVDQQLNIQGSLNGFKDEYAGPRGGCAAVTISPQGNTFPKTVTISFPQNCKTFAGADIVGTVSVNISGRIRESGTTAVFTLKEFKYKKYVVSGNYRITFNGGLAHITVISDGKVITSEGKTIFYSATNNATQTEGTTTTFKTNPTTFLQDDVYSITTTSQGINTKGNTFTVTTDQALIYKVACQWITAGKIKIIEDTRPKLTASLDYGDEFCDNKAILTFNNKSVEILLP